MALDSAVALVFLGVAALIAWRRAADPMAWLAAVLLVLAPVTFNLGVYNEDWSFYPQPWQEIFPLARDVLTWIGLASLLAFLLLFPNGRFGSRRIAGLAGLSAAAVVLTSGWLGVGAGYSYYVWFGGVLFMLISAGYIQVYRYQRLSSALERQQTKWVVAGIASMGVILLGIAGLGIASEGAAYSGIASLASSHLQLVLLVLLPVTLAISIFRYRLWDIDLIIRRTLIYSGLTASLVLVYFSSVVLLQTVFQAVTGNRQSQLVTVVSTLAIAALFVPLRQRLQNLIDRSLFRRKYDAAKIMAAFSASARDETNLQQLSERLLDVVDEAMQPALISLWLRPHQEPDRP
jgi:hypothetical protein